MKCRICGNIEDNAIYNAKEMMFGLREVFSYFRCNYCGCLQIGEFPVDMKRFYPQEYYSFSEIIPSAGQIKLKLIKIRDSYAVFKKGIIGNLLFRKFPDYQLNAFANISVTSHILDVGCGSGFIISRLREIGFKNVSGIDPFISETIKYSNGVLIEKKSLQEVEGSWDLISFNHVFEHIADPVNELKKVNELLKDNGLCILRIPNIDSFAWDHYKTDWIQLDAPRHFYLYSAKSINILAGKAGLKVEKIEFDSTSFQFWGSEQIRKDIPLKDLRSYSVNPGKSVFSKKTIREYETKAVELNNQNTGDQAIYYLRKQ